MRWFRFYTEVLNDPKVQTLSPEVFKNWINILCLASNDNGLLPVTLHETAYALRMSEKDTDELLNLLISKNLLEVVKRRMSPHGWDTRQYKSDTSNERVKRYRERNSNVTVTPPDTEQIQNRTDTEKERPASPQSVPNLSKYCIEGGVVKVLRTQRDKWEKQFPHINVIEHLINLDKHYAKLKEDGEDVSKWFMRTANALHNANEQQKVYKGEGANI